jgi:hypothetical protein
MKKYFAVTASSLLILLANNAHAGAVNLPIQLDYSLIKKALVSQLFTGENHSAQLWNDKHGCSFLTLANPKINGEKGQIRLLNDVQAQFGSQIMGQCLTLMKLQGVLETLQQPTLSADHSVLSLPVTKAIIYDQQGHPLAIEKLQDLIKKVAAPKLADVKIDLNKSRGDIEKTLTKFLPKENAPAIKAMLATLKFDTAKANDNGVAIKLAFDAPAKPAAKKPAAAFTPAELAQWQAAWKDWDAFLTRAIKQATQDAKSAELRKTLTVTLKQSRTAFQAGLQSHDANNDPVRVFFAQTWERLAPQLQALSKELPEIQGLRYATFIAATDVIYELDKIGAPLGLELSSDGLRQLARLLIADKQTKKAKPVP